MQAYPKGASPEQVPAQDLFISTSQLGGPKISCLHCLHCLDRSLILLINANQRIIFRPPRLPTDQPRQAPLPLLLSCTAVLAMGRTPGAWHAPSKGASEIRTASRCLDKQAAVALDIVTI